MFKFKYAEVKPNSVAGGEDLWIWGVFGGLLAKPPILRGQNNRSWAYRKGMRPQQIITDLNGFEFEIWEDEKRSLLCAFLVE